MIAALEIVCQNITASSSYEQLELQVLDMQEIIATRPRLEL